MPAGDRRWSAPSCSPGSQASAVTRPRGARKKTGTPEGGWLKLSIFVPVPPKPPQYFIKSGRSGRGAEGRKAGHLSVQPVPSPKGVRRSESGRNTAWTATGAVLSAASAGGSRASNTDRVCRPSSFKMPWNVALFERDQSVSGGRLR